MGKITTIHRLLAEPHRLIHSLDPLLLPLAVGISK
jgi:hypothetical protein